MTFTVFPSEGPYSPSQLTADLNTNFNDAQSQLNLKAPLANPTFTGTVTLGALLSTSSLSITATGANAITFTTNSTERMRIDSSGNVGIGTSSPGAKLHVLGNAYVQSGTIFTDAITSYGGTSLALNGGSLITVETSGTERLRIVSSGNFITAGTHYIAQPAQTSIAAAATLTIAELLTGIVQYTGAAANLTLPTGTAIEGGVASGLAVDRAFDFSIINTGSGTVTVVTNTGITTVGSLTVAADASGLFRVRKTATNTYTVYRLS